MREGNTATEGIYLTKKCHERGIERLPATKAILKGEFNVAVPIGVVNFGHFQHLPRESTPLPKPHLLSLVYILLVQEGVQYDV